MSTTLAQADQFFRQRQQSVFYSLVRFEGDPANVLEFRAHRDPSESWTTARSALVAIPGANGGLQVVPHFYLTVDLLPPGAELIGYAIAWDAWLLENPMTLAADKKTPLDVAVVAPGVQVNLVKSGTNQASGVIISMVDLVQKFNAPLDNVEVPAEVRTETAESAASADVPVQVPAPGPTDSAMSAAATFRAAAFAGGISQDDHRLGIQERLARTSATRPATPTRTNVASETDESVSA